MSYSVDIITREGLCNLDLKSIDAHIQSTLNVRILCPKPGIDEPEQAKIQEAFQLGAKIRFLDFSGLLSPSFININNTEKTENHSYFIETKDINFVESKSVISTIDRLFGSKKYRLVQEKAMQTSLIDIFISSWKLAIEGILLRPVDPQLLVEEKMSGYLKHIPHYAQLSKELISFQKVHTKELLSSTNYVKKNSLKKVSSIVSAFMNQNIQLFAPCFCYSNTKHFLLLPPISEIHENRLVIVDGTHRIYFALSVHQIETVNCLIISETMQLPGKPVAFSRVKEWPRRLPRSQTFENYNDSLFRRFMLMEQKLIGEENYIFPLLLAD